MGIRETLLFLAILLGPVFDPLCLAQGDQIWKITAFCPCKICTGKSSSHPAFKKTASGTTPVEGRTTAVNWLLFGTKIHIAGLGERVVEDRGAKSIFGTIASPRLAADIYFENHQEARKFGVQYKTVEVLP